MFAIFKKRAVFARLAGLVALSAAVVLPARAQRASQPPQSSPSGISVDASQQIFATLCALDAAGFAADTSTLAEMPARLALRGDLLKMQGPATEALRGFYRDHALADPGETLSRYITFALVVGPPPQFKFQVDHDMLPPDVLAIDGFQEIPWSISIARPSWMRDGRKSSPNTIAQSRATRRPCAES